MPLRQAPRVRDVFLPPENCGACGFRFYREPGYYSGVLTPLLPMLALASGALAAAVAHFGYGTDPDTTIRAGLGGILFGLVVFFRLALQLFIAFDHAITPARPNDRS